MNVFKRGFLGFAIFAMGLNAENVPLDYGVFGLNSVTIGDRASFVVNKIGTNQDIMIGSESNVQSEIIAAGNVNVGNMTSLFGDITAGGTVSLGSETTVDGIVAEDAAVPTYTIVSYNITPGAQDVVVDNWQSEVVAAGAYNEIIVRDNATLTFGNGQYSVNKLVCGNDSKLIFEYSQNENVSIYAEQQIEFLDRSEIVLPDENSIHSLLFYTNADHVGIGNDAKFVGDLIAPNGFVEIEDRSYIRGAIQGESIRIYNDTENNSSDYLTPVFEGVVDNCDGSFTAIWGYNNPNLTEQTIGVGPDNGFDGSTVDLGQPTTFLPGRIEDAFRTDIVEGTRLTWTLNNRSATATTNDPINVCRRLIKPVFNGVVKNGSDSFTAYFGYANHNDFEVTIPIGHDNNLSNGANSQLTTFQPGSHGAAFSISFTGESLTWSLDGENVTADASRAYYTRLPQSVIDAGIPVEGLTMASRNIDALVDNFIPYSVQQDLFYQVAEDVLSRYPDFEQVLGENGSYSPLLADFPGVEQQEIADNLLDIITTYEAAIRYEIIMELNQQITTLGFGKTLAGGGTTPNKDEVKVMMRYPLLIMDTYEAATAASDFVDAEFGNGRSATDNNRENSMKHSLWNALIVKKCGWYFFSLESAVDYAKEFTDAHESGASQDCDICSKMDYHNNAAGRYYVESVSTVDHNLIGIPYLETPGEQTLADYLGDKARNEAQYVDENTPSQMSCLYEDELVFIHCPARNCTPVDCSRPDQVATVTFDEVKVISRVISTTITVLTPPPPCPFIFTCGLWYSAWEYLEKRTIEQFIDLVANYEYDEDVLNVQFYTPTPIDTPKRLTCNDGTEVSFVKWEGTGTSYLSNEYDNNPSITIPQNTGNVELRAVYK